MEKRCSRCKCTKSSSKFNRNRAQKDGLCCWCKECRSEYCRLFPENNRARSKKWNRANPGYDWWKDNAAKHRAHVRNWDKLHPGQRRDRGNRRWAIKHGATIEVVKRNVVYDRDKGFCHICGGKANRNDWHLDHIIPLCKGGEHSYRNVAVSHPRCNLRKAAS